MKIHFIAIGGSAMHNLAIALKQKGYFISGSDDEIFDPSRGRLEKNGLLPNDIGWFPEKLDRTFDAVVLGMHARADNLELARAKELGIKIYSYPEYLFEQTKNKTRVVIGGSHGKTTITSMIMHVLKDVGRNFDYMVGAQIEGFENMVGLSNNTDIAIFEGDEYLTSPIDPRPKFHLYKPHIAVISGISWDHINVFPTFEQYLKQFELFTQTIVPNGHLIYCANDKFAAQIAANAPESLSAVPYLAHAHKVDNSKIYLDTAHGEVELEVFGSHNMENISAAKEVCSLLGISGKQFYKSISTFKGAAKRLERIKQGASTDVFLDFAHAPSKVAATVKALKETYPNRTLVACLELHTFSSLNKDFLDEYKGTLNDATHPIVYYNPVTLEHKKLPPISRKMVIDSFRNENLKVFDNASELLQYLVDLEWGNSNLLLMSSGNFANLNIAQLAEIVVSG
ncbi:MAG: Mur ligase family protein [Tenuifilaceae bacterium]|nr:Mur ligase family protein [Tenuifilaceae bacterium]